MRSMNTKRITKCCLILLAVTTACCLLPAPCSSAFDEYLTGARVRAMGGAYAALADDVNGVLGQPAALANLADTQLSVSYGQLYLGLSDGSRISDSSILFGMPAGKHFGIGAAYQSLSLNSTYSENTALLAAGASICSGLRAGAAAKMLTVSYGHDGYTDLDPVFAGGMSRSAMDADLGIIWQATGKISFAYTRNNLLGADLGLAETAPVTARDIVALGYREEDFTFDLEDQQGGLENRVVIGIEKLLIDHLLALRLGFGSGNRDYRKVSTGFGFNMKQFSIDYAFEYPLSGIEGTSGTHYLTICTHFGAHQTPAVEQCKIICEPKTPVPVPAPQIPAQAELQKPVCQEVKPVPVEKTVVTPAPETYMGSGKLQLLNMLQLQQFAVAPSTTPVVQPPAVSSAAVVPAPINAVAQSTAPANTEIKAVVPDAAEEDTEEPAAIQKIPKAKPAIEKPSPVDDELRPRTLNGQAPGKYTAIHRVVYGDSLPSLAEKYYHAKARWVDIYEANKDKIEKGTLQAGQILIIP